jgi:copper chaperone
MTETIVYTVPGIHCSHCERAVKDELQRVAGVRAVEVDLEAKRVTVEGGGLEDTALREAIAEAGYEAA